ncbi:MAG: hypothetical protein RJQ21_13540 [Rhodospirillales bacterium]
MNTELLPVIGIVALLAVVQSVFGMGILVFGTPTLLLMGYPFAETLQLLLPASASISLLQVLRAGGRPPKISKKLYVLCLPAVGLGLLAATRLADPVLLVALIGLTLTATALLRSSARLGAALTRFVQSNDSLFQVLMGGVHGLTNLGGALLSVYAVSISENKHSIRFVVAYFYFSFSVVQMATLALQGLYETLLSGLIVAVPAAVIFITIGQRVFLAASHPVYVKAFTIFSGIYGLLLLWRTLPQLI